MDEPNPKAITSATSLNAHVKARLTWLVICRIVLEPAGLVTVASC
jgi:hypothetical protein